MTTQTSLCAYLSVIALAGVALNTLLGWWWADPVAALAMVPIIIKEGSDGLRGETACADCGTAVLPVGLLVRFSRVYHPERGN